VSRPSPSGPKFLRAIRLKTAKKLSFCGAEPGRLGRNQFDLYRRQEKGFLARGADVALSLVTCPLSFAGKGFSRCIQ
jgi:hypothetical protein